MRGRFEDHGDPQEKLKTMIETLVQGGWTMIFLGICSVLAVWVGIERGLNLRRRKVVKPEIVAVIENLRGPEDLGLALSICRRHPGPFSNIIRVVLENRTLPKEELHEAVENQGRQEVATLERGLVVLETVAGVAPLLGLFGTVLGMIDIFAVISQGGVGQAERLSGGRGVFFMSLRT